jgi:ParB-like chromosome segregation protein Spo0J
MAATIRHNRARGRHQINAMSEIVRELAQLGWNDERIGKELGMDSDEVCASSKSTACWNCLQTVVTQKPGR